jgi:hypothetical protein
MPERNPGRRNGPAGLGGLPPRRRRWGCVIGWTVAESKAQASSPYLLFCYAGSSVVETTGGLLWKPYGWSGVVISLMTLLLLALAATAVLPALPKEPPPRKDPA